MARSAGVGSAKAIHERLEIPSGVRMGQADLAGASTGSIAIGIEYPDAPAYVAAQEKLAAD